MSGAAAPGARIRAQAAFDIRILLGNGEQVLVALVLPALALLAGVLSPVPDLPGSRVDFLTPGVLALAVLSSAFTGQAIATGFDRRYGVLRLLGVTPLGRGGLLAGRVLAVLLVEVLQFIVLGALGFALGWRPDLWGIAPFVVFWVVGTACFVAAAMLMAGTLRAEATLALANLVWVVLLGLGGILLPADRLPGPWSTLVSLLPSAALGDGFRAAFAAHALPLPALLVLLAWTVVFAWGASRFFRWSG